ncbi:MAG TPA: neutral/alkaline non-lysosomal ceramidase N-terminal domain-containing protein [Bryobacterales bacterium]|nr:neutral/alkaline non-lysosomal ceramidase N-terminal domain-containing protein [Bryobacterales bacterium]
MQRVLWLAAMLALGALGASAQSAWKAGAASVNITPSEPIWLAGYGDRTRPSEGVRQQIYAKALALQDSQGVTSVIVTSDLLGFPREVAEPIADRAQKQFGLPRERLVLNSSHTHSAPVIGNMLRPAYPYGEDQVAVIRRYTAWLEDRVVEVIGEAIHNLAPAQLSFEQGLAGVAVNRRRVGHREYPGPVDQDVPVLSVRGPDGSLRALVFGYACHNTVLNDYQINGDWAGYAQAELEKEHPGVTALFMEGCGADANPLPRRSVELAMKYGQILAAAVDQVLKAKMKPIGGSVNAAFARVDIPFQTPPSREEFERRLHDKSVAIQRHAKYMLQIYERDGKLPDRYPYEVEVWQFGRDLTWVMLAGEVVVDYSLRYKGAYGWDNTWVSGYSNDVFAYIPSERVLKEGGYEGGGAMIGYGQPGPFGWAVEEIIAEKVDELVKRVRGQ